MKLDDETKKLIAIGACVAANYKPCLETQVSQAKSMGIGAAEIEIAIKIGQSVQSGVPMVWTRSRSGVRIIGVSCAFVACQGGS